MAFPTKPAFLLVTGRTIGFAVSFAIPMALARSFTQDEFGTYRELFLIYATLYGLAQVGMAESLYYFVPRAPESAGRSSGNASLILAVAGVVCVLLLSTASPWVARWFSNPALGGYLPGLALFLALMLVSSTLEIVLVSCKRYAMAAVVYAGSDTLKALLFVIPALVFRSLGALMAGAVAFAALRCAILFARLVYDFGRETRVDLSLMKTQLAYALPFAAAVTVEIVQTNLHQYTVASWFDRATFAVYSVGCLQIPLVDLLSTSAANVMMVRMSEDLTLGQSVLPLWHDTVERLGLVFLPFFALVALTAREIILTLFTRTYLASVPIFIVSSSAIVLAAFPVDSVLRVYAQTRILLALNLLRLAFIAVSIAWFVSRFSLPGAALATVVAAAGTRLLAIGRIAQLMRAGLRDILPWRSLGKALAATLIAAVPAVLVRAHADAPALARAALIATVYGTVYVAILGAMWLAEHPSAWRAAPLEGAAESD